MVYPHSWLVILLYIINNVYTTIYGQTDNPTQLTNPSGSTIDRECSRIGTLSRLCLGDRFSETPKSNIVKHNLSYITQLRPKSKFDSCMNQHLILQKSHSTLTTSTINNQSLTTIQRSSFTSPIMNLSSTSLVLTNH